MLLEARSIYKEFGTEKNKNMVIKDVSISVEQGDFISIVGPSGSGKSTLLYLLSTLDEVTKGEVLFNGKALNSLSDREKSNLRNSQFGFVFQTFNLVKELNVEDNILLPIYIGGGKLKPDIARLNEIMDIVGITEKRFSYPNELSGGQQQRVAIARAIITNPKLVFADEPIGNLDSKNGKKIMELFSSINKEIGTTIIQVTHAVDTVKYGTRVVEIKDGRVEKNLNIRGDKDVQ